MRPLTVMAMCAPMMLVNLHSLASPRLSSIPQVTSATVKIGTSQTQTSPCRLWTMARSQPRFRKQQPSCVYGQMLPT
jgi:hypothetical protein